MSHYILQTIQDSSIVTVKGKLETAHKLLNGTSFSDIEWLTNISRSLCRHCDDCVIILIMWAWKTFGQFIQSQVLVCLWLSIFIHYVMSVWLCLVCSLQVFRYKLYIKDNKSIFKRHQHHWWCELFSYELLLLKARSHTVCGTTSYLPPLGHIWDVMLVWRKRNIIVYCYNGAQR